MKGSNFYKEMEEDNGDPADNQEVNKDKLCP